MNEPHYCSKSELDACRTVMESQAQALHRHSTARTDAALRSSRKVSRGHLESSLAKKVDWDAMKTTLDSQIRSVFRIQLQGLMKEVEQRVLDTLQAHHRGDAEAEHSTELSLAPAMTDVADAIDRMDQTASMVATIDDKVDEVVKRTLLAARHETRVCRVARKGRHSAWMPGCATSEKSFSPQSRAFPVS